MGRNLLFIANDEFLETLNKWQEVLRSKNIKYAHRLRILIKNDLDSLNGNNRNT